MKTGQRFDFAATASAAAFCALLALTGMAFEASAQTTDVASTPLITAAPNAVKPNIMFVLDDSGSMGNDYMPDDANYATSKYGRYASQCNGLAYNPAVNYSVPVDSTGANLAAGSYTFTSTTDTSTFPYYYTYSGTQRPLSYTYDSNGVITTTAFYRECNSDVGASPGNGLFTKVVVSPSTITQNYRNWYTYYRTRMLMMRTAASQAFKGIGDKYRVGFSTISSTSVDGTKFLDTSDFDATQKATWYSRLNGSNPSGYTPLRGAVSKAGMYFAKKARLGNGSTQTYDPVQFSCQKNFMILTTDGYWNTQNETGTYGPYKLDGTNVGQQDGSAPRPMRDAGIETYTVTTPMQQVMHWFRTRTQTQRTTEQYTEYQDVKCPGGGNRQVQQRTVSRYRDATSTERSYYTNTQTYDSVVTYVSGTPGAAVKQNVVDGTYSSEGTTTTSAFVNGSWSGWSSGAWSNIGSCAAGNTAPPNSAVTSSTAAPGAWSGYSIYNPATPASDPAVATGPGVESGRTSVGGSSDSLADVAMYYYETDLRTSALGNCVLANGTNVCNNNVPPRGADNVTHQHMTTFTVGMGVSGTLGYDPNYLGGASADFQAIIAGTKNWPNPTSGAETVDDLWHAAVNGRGQYFSAGDPTVLARSLSDTLAAIDARSGTAAAAATSTLQPTPGDNTEYVTSYTTVQWVGDLNAYTVNPDTGARSATPIWSAQQLLDARVAAGTARNIYYMQRTAGTNVGTLRAFTYSNLQADGLNANFDGACSKSPALAQCANTGFDVSGANNGANLVTWLRGQPDTRYRARQHLLGDTVGGAPVYVRKPPFAYTENGYQAWVSAINASNSGAGRKGVVYVPANDGMLHAIDGSTGQELWAYVPTMVMNRLYKLADIDYATKHEFFVNGTPAVGDIWVPPVGMTPGTWKTILVGGLGAGGRGYYALDITNPDSPKMLWEFANDSLGGNGNLGQTFGNPVITKRTNGQWIVAFSSGYNNVAPGDGNGRLFVVDANSGQRLTELQTYTAPGVPAGNTTTPSGLAKINNWVESSRDNTTLRYYGGDLLGNLWRFDIDAQVAPNNAALRLAELRGGSPAAPQPITTRPELAVVTYGGINYPVVYVGTGKLLGLSDLSSTGQQSVYAIKDPLTNTPLGDVHARSDMVAQTLTENPSTLVRTVSNNLVDWSSKIGWRVDLVTGGERVNIDMRLALTTLVVAANAPLNDACTAGGTSYLYQFDFTSGSSLPGTNGVAGVWLGNSFAVGVGVIQLYSSANGGAGTGGATARVQMGDGGVSQSGVYTPTSAAVQGRRTSWRELVN